MSELINKNDNRATIRWKLLTGASVLALSAYVSSLAAANADGANNPSIWIELGGQLDRQSGLGHTYVPDFIANNPDSPIVDPISPLHYERPPLYAMGLDGKITFQPDDSDWSFSASMRYGRSGGRKNVTPGKELVRYMHYTRAPERFFSYPAYMYVTILPPKTGTQRKLGEDFAPTQVSQKQTHEIVDFSAGKDVGLGLFGRNISSTVDAGVRFAQFRSNTSATIHARPDTIFGYVTIAGAHRLWPQYDFKFPFTSFSTYAAEFRAQREFAGVGPTLSWNASVPIAGNPSDEALTIDWGINAALLFGHQRAKGSHHTSGHHHKYNTNSAYYTTNKPFDRSRDVTVPNVGGMLGMSVKFPNAKVSIGYRGDFFFGAMDTGVDTRKTGTTGFYGPFATISIGIGD